MKRREALMALTTAELLDIRQVVGDVDQDGTKLHITDDAIVQGYFDDAGGDLPTTYLIYLRRLVGITLHKISVSDSFGRQEEQQQLHEHYKGERDYWGSRLSSKLGSSVTRAYRADSAATEEPNFSEGRP